MTDWMDSLIVLVLKRWLFEKSLMVGLFDEWVE